MSIANLTEFTTQVSLEMGDLATKVAAGAFEQVSNKTFNEFLGQWSYPITDDFQSYWFLERGKRHLIYIFLIASAHKFKFKQISLNNRFDHYIQLIRLMDDEFLKAAEDNPMAFPVASGGVLFPMYLANTFNYDFLGREYADPYLVLDGEELIAD